MENTMSNNDQDDAIKEVLSEIQAENEKIMRDKENNENVVINEVESSHPSSYGHGHGHSSAPPTRPPLQSSPPPSQHHMYAHAHDIPSSSYATATPQHLYNKEFYAYENKSTQSNISRFVDNLKKNMIVYALIGIVVILLDTSFIDNILSKLYGSVSISYFDKLVKSAAGIIIFIILERIVDHL